MTTITARRVAWVCLGWVACTSQPAGPSVRAGVALGFTTPARPPAVRPAVVLNAGPLDYVNPNYWRREYITAAMLTTNVPLTATVVLELAPPDGKLFHYYPPTVQTVVTVGSTAEDKVLDDNAKRAQKELVKRDEPADCMPSVPSNSIDVVVCVQALARVQDKAGCLDEAFRVLRPGGRLLFVEPLEEVAAFDATEFDDVKCEQEAGCMVGFAVKPMPAEAAPGSGGGGAPLGGAFPQDGPNRDARRRQKGSKTKRRAHAPDQEPEPSPPAPATPRRTMLAMMTAAAASTSASAPRAAQAGWLGAGTGPLPGVTATDRNGAEVIAEKFLAKLEAVGSMAQPELVLGLAGEPYYLLANDERTALLPFALKAECTHLGCLAAWEPANGRFGCPCHGSQYTADGRVQRGPAPRSLGLAKVSITDDGKVLFEPWEGDDFRDAKAAAA